GRRRFGFRRRTRVAEETSRAHRSPFPDRHRRLLRHRRRHLLVLVLRTRWDGDVGRHHPARAASRWLLLLVVTPDEAATGRPYRRFHRRRPRRHRVLSQLEHLALRPRYGAVPHRPLPRL